MGIHFHSAANAGARWAGTERTVKRKEMRFDFRQADMTIGAGKMLAERENFLRCHAINMDNAIAELSCRFQRIRKARQDTFLNDQSIDNDLDGMFLFLSRECHQTRGILRHQREPGHTPP